MTVRQLLAVPPEIRAVYPKRNARVEAVAPAADAGWADQRAADLARRGVIAWVVRRQNEPPCVVYCLGRGVIG